MRNLVNMLTNKNLHFYSWWFPVWGFQFICFYPCLFGFRTPAWRRRASGLWLTNSAPRPRTCRTSSPVAAEAANQRAGPRGGCPTICWPLWSTSSPPPRACSPGWTGKKQKLCCSVVLLHIRCYDVLSSNADWIVNTSNKPVSQTVNQPVKQPVNQPVNQPVKQPINQPVNQPVKYLFLICFVTEGHQMVVYQLNKEQHTFRQWVRLHEYKSAKCCLSTNFSLSKHKKKENSLRETWSTHGRQPPRETHLNPARGVQSRDSVQTQMVPKLFHE